MDIEKALDRKEIARRDCKTCGGKGWTGEQNVSEQSCETCGGTGMEEKEVPYDFANGRQRTPAELAHIAWGDPIPQAQRRKDASAADEY